MKPKNLLLVFVFAFITLGLVSCSSDDEVDKQALLIEYTKLNLDIAEREVELVKLEKEESTAAGSRREDLRKEWNEKSMQLSDMKRRKRELEKILGL